MPYSLTSFKFSQFLLPTLLFIGTLTLLGRLVFLQIIKGGEYRALADSNRIEQQIIHAPRGIIYDRNGYPLVRNLPGFRIREATLTGEKIRVVNREEALTLQAKGDSQLETDSLREYLYPEEFAHLLGYLGEDEKSANIIGKAGLEKSYNNLLVGVDGKKLVEVDNTGAYLRQLGEQQAVTGKDLHTTLDLFLQKKAFEAMKDVERGALVVVDPRNGEILALVSKPSFDPNLFTIGEGYKEATREGQFKTVQEIFNSPDQPLFNRVISGVYPPGSTFKIVTAAAALEEGAITKNTQIEDIGVLRIGVFSFPNWYFMQYGKLEGLLNIVGAIKRSNDIFFYKIAELVGIEKLAEMAKKFGLGSRLGIDIEGEVGGLFPNDEWKRAQIGDQWYLGDTYHVGIGQGYLLTTPLQVNAWTAVIANGGTLYQPRLIKNEKLKMKNEKFLRKETVELIREGMRQACDVGGTGWPLFKFRIQNSKLRIDERNFFLPEEATHSASSGQAVSGITDDFVYIPVACKTGTAEFGPSTSSGQARTHAWFTVFAPIADPQIAVTVLVEGGGEGSNVAAPIAKKILEEWFLR